MKETYSTPLLEMIEFSAQDIITTSVFQYIDNETEVHQRT